MPVSIVGGLPAIIPGTLRSLMRSNDLRTIRGVLTTLSVYRILKMPCKLKLETITDPFKGQSSTLPAYEVLQALRSLNISTKKRLLNLHSPLSFLVTSGPNHPVSMMGI